MSRILGIGVLLGLFVMALVGAQEATKPPVLSELEAAKVEISLQNETIVRLKIQLAELQKQYDVLQLTLDRQQRTPPPREGHIWSWERNADGQIKGYVKPEKAAATK